MQYLDDVVDYFRYLCTQHPDLLHSDTVGQRVFEVRDLDEAFGALRSGAKEKACLVRLILPTMDLRSESNNARLAYQLGLLVAKYHGRREVLDADTIEAIAASEKIAGEILERVVSDSRNGHSLFGSSVDQASDLKATGEVLLRLMDGTYSGVLFMFEFTTFRKIYSQVTVDCDGITWLDGGLTPP